MSPQSLVVYVATYPSVDHATDDFAGVRRLQRDGVIRIVAGAIVARDALTGALRRAHTPADADGPDAGSVVDQLLEMLQAVSNPGGSREDQCPSAVAPGWLMPSDVDEIREQLAAAPAAALVIGGAALGPAVNVALARAHSLLAYAITAAGARVAASFAAAAASAV